MRKNIKVPASIEGLAELLGIVENDMKGCDYSLKNIRRISIIIDEIAGNIVRYAYYPNSGQIIVKLSFKNKYISLCFIDSGIPYNPLTENEPNVDFALEDRNSGGLGIYIVRKFVDKMKYRRNKQKNHLFLRLNII